MSTHVEESLEGSSSINRLSRRRHDCVRRHLAPVAVTILVNRSSRSVTTQKLKLVFPYWTCNDGVTVLISHQFFLSITERVQGCHFLDCRVLQKSNVASLDQAFKSSFKPSVWICTSAPAAWSLSNAQFAQFVRVVTLNANTNLAQVKFINCK